MLLGTYHATAETTHTHTALTLLTAKQLRTKKRDATLG